MGKTEEDNIPSSSLDECVEHFNSVLIKKMKLAKIDCSIRPDVINSQLSVQLSVSRQPRNLHLIEILDSWQRQIDDVALMLYKATAKVPWRENSLDVDRKIVNREYIFPR